MINAKNQKTALVAIVAIAALVIVSTLAIGSGRVAAQTTTITKTVHNNGTNVQTETNQKQDCTAAGEQSGIADSCHASSSDNVESSGGILNK
jgi:hypothetical protein